MIRVAVANCAEIIFNRMKGIIVPALLQNISDNRTLIILWVALCYSNRAVMTHIADYFDNDLDATENYKKC